MFRPFGSLILSFYSSLCQLLFLPFFSLFFSFYSLSVCCPGRFCICPRSSTPDVVCSLFTFIFRLYIEIFVSLQNNYAGRRLAFYPLPGRLTLIKIFSLPALADFVAYFESPSLFFNGIGNEYAFSPPISHDVVNCSYTARPLGIASNSTAIFPFFKTVIDE